MSSILDDFKRTTISVQTRNGSAGAGATFAAAVTRRPVVSDVRKQVRAANGELTVSETTLYDDLSAADLYAVGSKVTVRGRPATVIKCARQELSDPDVDHVEVALT